MFKFSWSLLFSGIFTAYVLHSIYSIVGIYIPPTCGDGSHCLKSFLANKPKLQLILGTTHKSELRSWKELTLVDRWTPFDYTKDLIIKNITIPLPRQTRKNGTLHIYAFAAPMPRSADETEYWDKSLQSPTTIMAYFQLTQYLVPEAATFNLLKDSDVTINKGPESQRNSTTKERSRKTDCSHRQKTKADNADRSACFTFERFAAGFFWLDSVRRQLKKFTIKDLHNYYAHCAHTMIDFIFYAILFSLGRLVSSDTYLPPMRFDRFNSRLRDFYKINDTDTSYEMEFEFAPASIGSIRMAAQFQAAMDAMNVIGFTSKDMDEIKGVFADTNVYLLALTLFVASMHLLFDFLAFKNDVIYWKQRKTTAGLSFRTIIWRCFSQTVVFLYLLEEKSSMLVILPAAIGSVIEMWKVSKALKVTIEWKKGSLPRLCFGKFTESEMATAKHDVESMQYLSYIMYPLCLGGAVYSLLYTPHKSWYSWTIQSMVNGVYAFGFLFMLPQLFINYRLKSVAHLPWRAFMYKAFNTFIDDIFAFIITMPTAHRVACFRDDIVFIIYLYQRWLYPVDNTRIDAGGSVEYEAEESDKKTK
ncbi:Cleft lip and palate transmembrane protein 1-like protein [Folsomia candida]|uniref:Lipid scramblase CLPTM1L n=1 Tax=Folsomia candida TaxID=158441 RepID=A0A226DEZ3_FOLCA|nr:Cleft lip and palate transmembrane protein 1-like protein [Folsomia candida]